MAWGYGRENSYLKTQLDGYKEELKGATPQEASDRIKALEAVAAIAIGKRWTPLASAEVKGVSDALQPYKGASYIHISYANQLGRDLAKSLEDCFRAVGRKISMNAGAPSDPGIFIGHGQNAQDVKKILEDHSTLRLQIFREGQAEMSGRYLSKSASIRDSASRQYGGLFVKIRTHH
jgi:hypothetical protein